MNIRNLLDGAASVSLILDVIGATKPILLFSFKMSL